MNMLKYVGKFSLLKDLGFICDINKSYYYLPSPKRERKNKYYNPITINKETREVEYTDKKDLIKIEKFLV